MAPKHAATHASNSTTSALGSEVMIQFSNALRVKTSTTVKSQILLLEARACLTGSMLPAPTRSIVPSAPVLAIPCYLLAPRLVVRHG